MKTESRRLITFGAQQATGRRRLPTPLDLWQSQPSREWFEIRARPSLERQDSPEIYNPGGGGRDFTSGGRGWGYASPSPYQPPAPEMLVRRTCCDSKHLSKRALPRRRLTGLPGNCCRTRAPPEARIPDNLFCRDFPDKLTFFFLLAKSA